MALLNSAGSPVATKRVAIQIDLDVPAEAVANVTSPNWGSVLGAAIQLVLAMMTGNTAGIAAAIQALLVALMG